MDLDKKEFKIGLRRQFFNKNLKQSIIDKGFDYNFISRKIKKSPVWISNMVNFKANPNEETRIKLAILLGQPIDYLFPESYDEIYNRIAPLKRTSEVSISQLQLNSAEVLSIEAPDTLEYDASKALWRDRLEALMELLDPRERKILRMRFGFEDGDEHTLQEVGEEFGVSRDRIRQIEAIAFERLKELLSARYSNEYEVWQSGSGKNPLI